MIKLSFFQLRVTNVKLEHIKLHLKSLTGRKTIKSFFILDTLYYTLQKY